VSHILRRGIYFKFVQRMLARQLRDSLLVRGGSQRGVLFHQSFVRVEMVFGDHKSVFDILGRGADTMAEVYMERLS
jgi:hypothetical protein